MPTLTCGEVRRFLGALGSGTQAEVAPEVFQVLLDRRAVSGSVGSAELTAIGKHVLSELEVRAYRTDSLSLDAVGEQLARVLHDLDEVAKSAEYFLADLGAIAPPEALPMLRPIAVGLANRRETPDERAQEFRKIWGGVEVMGGDPRDRLLAAALLDDHRADMETIYSPLMTTTTAVRDAAGPKAPAVTVATLLHLHPKPDGRPAWNEYLALRKNARTEEGAAMLAATGRPVDELLRTRGEILQRLAPGGTPTGDHQVAAGFLTVAGARPDTHVPRTATLVRALGTRLASPTVGAAVLAMVDWLEPGELMNWLDKATEVARSRKLAPSASELATLGLTLVLGLPPTEFATSTMPTVPSLLRTANLVAINAWLYGELIPHGPAPARAA